MILLFSTELFFDDGRERLENRENMRDAFSDAEDYLDQGLVSAKRCASRTSSVGSWPEHFRPSFTEKLKFKSVMEGEQTAFKCKMVASPAPNVAWFHNNRPIRKDSRKVIKTESTMHIHSSSLEINNVEEKDSGSYKIFAINSEGSAESTASLLVALKEEQNENYLNFVKRSVMAHQSMDTLVKNRNARLKVDLRHVGSPFEKKFEFQGALQNKSNSRSRLMRTMYIESTFTATKYDDPAINRSAVIYSPRLCGTILNKDSLIDEDIKIKLHLLREAKRKKRFSLALSEASFDLDTSTENNQKYSHVYLDRERSRSMGDLNCMNHADSKCRFVYEQTESPGDYFRKGPLERQQQTEQILGLPSLETELKNVLEENIIEESSRTEDIKPLNEQILKGDSSQETEESHEDQYCLEPQESGKRSFQKEFSDQLFGKIISVQRDFQSDVSGETLDYFIPGTRKTKAAGETEVVKQFADTVECTDILLKEKEFLTPVKQTLVEITEPRNKYKFNKNNAIFSDQSVQNSLARKTRSSHSMSDHFRATEKYESSFTEKEDIMGECAQKLIPSLLPEKNISVPASPPLDANAVEINKTLGKCEAKKDYVISSDNLPRIIFQKQMPGSDCRTVYQTKLASKENEAISVINIDEKVVQSEGKIKDDSQTILPSTLPEKKEISSFTSSLIKNTQEDIKHIPNKTTKVRNETSIRHAGKQNDLLTQKTEVVHEIPDHSSSEMIDVLKINQKERQYEKEIIDSVHVMRHSPLSAKKREASAFFSPVLKQLQVGIKKPPKESEVHEKDEPASERSYGHFIYVESDYPVTKSEDCHEIQMAVQSKLAVKQIHAIGVSEISQHEQCEGKVKDPILSLAPSVSENKDASPTVSSYLKETVGEMRETQHISEVNEGTKIPPAQFAGGIVSTMRNLVAEKSDKVLEASNLCTSVEVINISNINQNQKEPQYKKQINSTIHPFSPDRNDAPTSLSTSEPTEDHKADYIERCGMLFQAQKKVLPEKLDNNNNMYFQSLKAAKDAEEIYEDEIRQNESQSEAKVPNSTWMMKASPLSEEKETSVYKKETSVSSVFRRDSPWNLEFKEDHMKTLERFASTHKEDSTEKLESDQIISDQSAFREPTVINATKIDQKQHEREVECLSPTMTHTQTSPLKEKTQTLDLFSSLIKETPAEDHHYKYKAMNESSKAGTPSINLNKHCPPVFFQHITSPKIKQGATCVLECQFHGHPQPMVTWYKDEHPIPQNRGYDIYSTENKSSLSISCICQEHGGVYACVIFNQHGTAATSCVLAVQGKIHHTLVL